jgi:hypothetical protein
VTAAPPIKILTACAEKWALQCAFGEMDIPAAVDGLQYYAERGLVAELGQDRIQDIIAAAFVWAREVVDTEVYDEADDTVGPGYAADIVRQWELADARDRWRHTGEAPPAIEISPATKPAYRTPQSTIDAFWCVVRSDDPDLIARWLAGHPADVAHLHEIWGQKCAIAA